MRRANASIVGDYRGPCDFSGQLEGSADCPPWWFDSECLAKPFIFWASVHRSGFGPLATRPDVTALQVLEHDTPYRYPSAVEWLFSDDDLRSELREAGRAGALRTNTGYSEVMTTSLLLQASLGVDPTQWVSLLQDQFKQVQIPPNLLMWSPLDTEAIFIPSADCISVAPYFPAAAVGYVARLGPDFGGLSSLSGLSVALSRMCNEMRSGSEYGAYLRDRESDLRWDHTWQRVCRFVGGWELTEADVLTPRSPAAGVTAAICRQSLRWTIELAHA